MAQHEPIHRRKLYQEVLERLIARITAGEFGPDDQLPSERELMDSYGVGRPAVREALQQLERSGIVTITHGERARVVVPTPATLVAQIASGTRHLLSIQPDSLNHLKEARLFLEIGMAQLAAANADATALAQLQALVEAQRRAIDQPEEFLRCDMAFHRQIAAMSGNPIYPAIVEGMFGWLAEYYRSLVRAPGAEQLTLAEHDRIVAAVASHDPAKAAQAMSEHLTRANALYRHLTRHDENNERAGKDLE
ncbi:transcriptional regulator NanR [Bradyrhizobium prioriisuperbiae]|uniref:transcriptional regulator NanR n=1 Tax=Bradyrhizobium prioriisuperbiae TaxID=2854389 RepID=UPI0028E2D263|nr:transcriptional regulator NanR [Bradyrhizobium prioritasuperba]